MIGAIDVLGALLAFVGIWIFLLDRRKGFGPMLVALALLLTSGAFARDSGQWAASDPAIREWYRGLMMPDLPMSPCSGSKPRTCRQ